MSISLYNLAHEHRALVERLMSEQDDEQAIADTLEAESWPLEQKAQSVGYAVKNLEALAAAIKQAEAEMVERRKRIESRARNLREYAKTCMEIAGVSKIDCPHFAIALRKNPASVDVFEPGLIPAEYMRQLAPPPPMADKAAIKEALKAGKDVPGAKLVAGTRLEVK